MSSIFIDDEEVLEYVATRVKSDNYWTFIFDHGPTALDLSRQIEETYYNSKKVPGANADFELIFTANPNFPIVVMAHKRRMSLDELNEIMHPNMAERDIVRQRQKRQEHEVDFFPISTTDGGARLVLDFTYRLDEHMTKQRIRKYGKEAVLGKQCYYQYTLLAQQEGQENEICKEKPAKILACLDKKDGQPASAALCQKHFDAVVRWISKQPEVY